MSKNQSDFIVPGLPTRDAAKTTPELIYSDHVPQLVSISDILIMTWNVYDETKIFGYDYDEVLNKEEQKYYEDNKLLTEKLEFLDDFRKKVKNMFLSAQLSFLNDVLIQEIINTLKMDVAIDETSFADFFAELSKLKDLSFDDFKIKIEIIKSNIMSETPSKKFILSRNQRVSNAILGMVKNNPKVNILAFQEMSNELMLKVQKDLSEDWSMYSDKAGRVIFYKKDAWNCTSNNQSTNGLFSGITLVDKTNKSKIIQVNNMHGNPEDFAENLKETIEGLSPLSSAETLSIIVGDFNAPLRRIQTQKDVTCLCPKQFNDSWVSSQQNSNQALQSTTYVVHALDGAFASQNHQLIECIIKPMDVTTGKVINENGEFSLNYIPKETKYLEEYIKSSYKNCLTVNAKIGDKAFSFECQHLSVDLFNYAIKRFSEKKDIEYFHAPFSSFFGGYSILEKAQALQLLQLFLMKSKGIQTKDFANFVKEHQGDMPRILGALQQGNLGCSVEKEYTFRLIKMKNEIDDLIKGFCRKNFSDVVIS
jgi:hypothetical protein